MGWLSLLVAKEELLEILQMSVKLQDFFFRFLLLILPKNLIFPSLKSFPFFLNFGKVKKGVVWRKSRGKRSSDLLHSVKFGGMEWRGGYGAHQARPKEKKKSKAKNGHLTDETRLSHWWQQIVAHMCKRPCHALCGVHTACQRVLLAVLGCGFQVMGCRLVSWFELFLSHFSLFLS